ncbi:kinase-like domain-containing protein [Amylostereum chailletii]|nr:kinase-like domain-containing protein [Amylostereum chailletii]
MPYRHIPNLVGETVDAGRLLVVEVLGTGAFGAVYRAEDTLTSTHYAIKCLFPDSPARQALLAKRGLSVDYRFAVEAEHHALASDHPNVLTLHRTFTEQGDRYLVLDLCEGGTLLEVLQTPHFWQRDDRIKQAFIQLVDAVSHCHNKGIAHRDLKPDNILLSADKHHYYLADFGLATKVITSHGFGAGSKCYKSPECIGKEHSAKTYDTQTSDVWAIGIILINVLTGQFPWEKALTSDEHYEQYLKERTHLSFMTPLSPQANALLSRVLEPNPILRITLAELRNELIGVERFLMSEAELAHASEYARDAYEGRAQSLGVEYRLPPAVDSSPPTPSMPSTPDLVWAPDTTQTSDIRTPSPLTVIVTDLVTTSSAVDEGNQTRAMHNMKIR